MSSVFPGLPVKEGQDGYGDIRRVTNNILGGKLNVAGSFTVTAGTSETEVSDRNVGENSFIGITGIDENSLTNGIYIKSRDPRSASFTVGHDSVGVDRNYTYIVIG